MDFQQDREQHRSGRLKRAPSASLIPIKCGAPPRCRKACAPIQSRHADLTKLRHACEPPSGARSPSGCSHLTARGSFAAVAQAAQFTRPSAAQDAWVVNEWSVNGPITSEWTAQSATKLQRRWTLQKMLNLDDAADTQEVLQDAEGRTDVELDDERIASVSSTVSTYRGSEWQ